MSDAPIVRRWLAEPLDAAAETTLARLERAEDVRRIVVLPDAHHAEGVCVGTVVATTRRIYPPAVGSDIGCGMAALGFDVAADRLEDPYVAARLLAAFGQHVPARSHRRAARAEELPESTDGLSDAGLRRFAARDGLAQLGTLGRGNHFLEIQADESGMLWVMLHSGSRGIGRAIHEHHLARAATDRGALPGLDADSQEGRAYVSDHAWAIRYAAANREAILTVAARCLEEVLGASPRLETLITCHHNHVQCECHEGEQLLVHRKGALQLAKGAEGVIPGSMGAPSFHVTGRGSSEALDSSSHGAGRAMPRGEARRRISVAALERQMRGIWFDHGKVEHLRDEAPEAYKDIGAVLRAQRDLVRVTRRLRPLLSYKSG